MLFRTISGNIPEIDRQNIDKVINLFENMLEEASRELPGKIIRPKIPGSVFVFRDPEKYIVAYAPRSGQEVRYIDSERNILPSHVIRDLSMQLDLDDVSVAVLPKYVIDLPEEQQRIGLLPAVKDLISRSVSAFEMQHGISAFSPIFGPNKYPVQHDLVFVLMPFNSELDKVYSSIVRPALQDDLGLVCRRADEIKGNNPIMHDIWKSICEARIVLADLTDFNPNVMYELGIAHTLGKPSLLIYQDSNTTSKFPFDLSHIRRINYQDSAAGGVKLRKDIGEAINAMLAFEA